MTTYSDDFRETLADLLLSEGDDTAPVFFYAGTPYTQARLVAELEGGTGNGDEFITQLMIAAKVLLQRAKDPSPDEPIGGLTLCACKHASGHHDFQQGGRCLKHCCGCLQFDPKESVDPEAESEEEIRIERDSLVAMYNRSQVNTTHERRMMAEALGLNEDGTGSHAALLISVCSELRRLREKR